jgi:hypothetical protein
MTLSFRAAKTWITKRVTPDYTDQLDLFSEAPTETPDPVANTPRRVSGVSQPLPRPQQLGFDAWEPLPPFDAGAVVAKEPASPNTGADGTTVHRPPVRPDIGAEDGISPPVGAGDRRNLSAEKVLDIEPEEKPSRDFRITSAHRIGQGTLHDKARDNVAANALNTVIMSWRDDMTPQVRAHFKGFEILSRGSAYKDGEPDLFVRGKETYKANLNPENPLGTIQSIEHTLRGLDRRAEEEQYEIGRQEKALADYRAQLGRPFEYDVRLKDLLAKQAQLNACLDLDKHGAQIVDEPAEPGELHPAYAAHHRSEPATPAPPAGRTHGRSLTPG